MFKLINGDCLEVMDRLIEQGVVVDAIITDPPYGTTSCKWDSVIPFNNHIMLSSSKRSKKVKPIYKDDYILQELKAGREYQEICEYFDTNSKEGMWQKLNKLIKPNGAIVLFGSEPFSSALRMSNIKNYKYDWVWLKSRSTGHLDSKKKPMKCQENISVFYTKQPTYNYECKKLDKPVSSFRKNGKSGSLLGKTNQMIDKFQTETGFPIQVLSFANEHNVGKNTHPTQKPVALMEYLIKTYTNECEIVLDFTMGSGTTGVACKNLNRDFIGIEKDEKYYNIAKDRINGQLI
jgi:site-specific DNA-methyltransferase (adenine-specific)